MSIILEGVQSILEEMVLDCDREYITAKLKLLFQKNHITEHDFKILMSNLAAELSGIEDDIVREAFRQYEDMKSEAGIEISRSLL